MTVGQKENRGKNTRNRNYRLNTDLVLQYRLINEITQKNLADMLNVTVVTMWRWEAGQAFPRKRRLKQLATIMGVSLSDLLLFSPNYPEQQRNYEQAVESRVNKLAKKSERLPSMFFEAESLLSETISHISDENLQICEYLISKIAKLMEKETGHRGVETIVKMEKYVCAEDELRP